MRSLRLWFLVLLLIPTGAIAQPVAAPIGGFERSPAGEPVTSVAVFYDQLSPYGVWVQEPRFGLVFVPDIAGYVPYRDGYWQYTNVGFVWVSSEPFAWATNHYGRWVYLSAQARWAWRPDTVWGPAWVEWRQYGDYYGWAPLAPEFAARVRYRPPFEGWHWCAGRYLFDRRLPRYYVTRDRMLAFHRGARRIDRYAEIGGARVIVGPSPTMLRRQRIEIRRMPLDPRASGRWSHDEWNAAARRAQQRRPWNEEHNRRRVERNPGMRQHFPPGRPPR